MVLFMEMKCIFIIFYSWIKENPIILYSHINYSRILLHKTPHLTKEIFTYLWLVLLSTVSIRLSLKVVILKQVTYHILSILTKLLYVCLSVCYSVCCPSSSASIILSGHHLSKHYPIQASSLVSFIRCKHYLEWASSSASIILCEHHPQRASS